MTSPVGEESAPSVELASRSDVGQVRSANEDSCEIFTRPDGTRLLVVADGMGGARGGATASQTAVSTIADHFESRASERPSAMLASAIQAANARVYEMAQLDPELEGMGTTVVAFMLDHRRRGTVAHVGDSRAYRYRRGRLEPITTDHSVVAEMQRRGLLSPNEAAVHPRRNEILRAVGVLPEVDVEIAEVDVAPGDRFLLCSDGLSGVVQDEEIAAVVQAESPSDAVIKLIRLANERGGPDNITVQVLAIPATEAEGDPEATAPVEISEVGIQAIETRRRERQRARRIAVALALFAAAAGAYFLWQFLSQQPARRSAPAPSEKIATEPFRSGSAPETSPPEKSGSRPQDRFEVDSEAPRRGIPRDGGSR